MYPLALAGAAVVILFAACDSTGIRRQAQVADGIARSFNTVARPTLVQSYEASCRAAIEASCPNPPCERAAMTAAFNACDARWQYAFIAYESARYAHDAWRATLMRCQGTPDGGTCTVDLQRDAAEFLRTADNYRCVVRALGHAELDPIPGTPNCEAFDGGH